MKRKKAAGLRTTASGSNFMYQPEEGDSEQGGPRESDREDAEDHGEDGADAHGEDGPDACREHSTDAHGEHSTDANEEDVKSTNEKADGILNFLKSTQEIYFYDGRFFYCFFMMVGFLLYLNNGIHLFGKIKKYSKICKCL